MIVLGDHILYFCWISSILSQEYLKTASWLKEVYGSGKICYLFVLIYISLINLSTHTYVRRSWLTEIGEQELRYLPLPLFLCFSFRPNNFRISRKAPFFSPICCLDCDNYSLKKSFQLCFICFWSVGFKNLDTKLYCVQIWLEGKQFFGEGTRVFFQRSHFNLKQ